MSSRFLWELTGTRMSWTCCSNRSGPERRGRVDAADGARRACPADAIARVLAKQKDKLKSYVKLEFKISQASGIFVDRRKLKKIVDGVDVAITRSDFAATDALLAPVGETSFRGSSHPPRTRWPLRAASTPFDPRRLLAGLSAPATLGTALALVKKSTGTLPEPSETGGGHGLVRWAVVEARGEDAGGPWARKIEEFEVVHTELHHGTDDRSIDDTREWRT